MADLNPWLIAAMALMLAIPPCAAVVARRDLADGLAALQLAGLITLMASLLLAAGFHRSIVADIPMALAILAFPSSLLFAHFLERWL
jgi:multisubunit Na+/H+ antiporter MnhF subunit